MDNPLSGEKPQLARLIFLLICVTTAFYGLIYRGILTYLPTHFSQNSGFFLGNHLWIGFLTAAVLTVGAFGQYYGGVISDRLKLKGYGILSIFALSIPLLLGMGFLKGVPLIALSGLLSILIFAYQPMQKHLIADSTPGRRRGISYGVINAVLFGFGSLASLIGGWLIDRFAVNFIFILMGGVAFLPACIVATQLILVKKAAKAAKEAPDRLELTPA